MSTTTFICAKCGVIGVRLYRPYGEFLRAERIACNACVPDGDRDWYVPMLPAGGLSAWGYTSATDESLAAWDALPERDPSMPGAFNRGRRAVP